MSNLIKEIINRYSTPQEDKGTFKANMDGVILSASSEYVSKQDGDNETLRFRLTEKKLDRDSEVVLPDGGQYREFLDNPVMLWAHTGAYLGKQPIPAIGKGLPETIEITDQYTEMDFLFDEDNDPFAKLIANKYRTGFLSKGSIGFRVLAVDKEPIFPYQKGVTITKWILLEYSAVNVPSLTSSGVVRRRDFDEGMIKFFKECQKYNAMATVKCSEKIDILKSIAESRQRLQSLKTFDADKHFIASLIKAEPLIKDIYEALDYFDGLVKEKNNKPKTSNNKTETQKPKSSKHQPILIDDKLIDALVDNAINKHQTILNPELT